MTLRGREPHPHAPLALPPLALPARTLCPPALLVPAPAHVVVAAVERRKKMEK